MVACLAIGSGFSRFERRSTYSSMLFSSSFSAFSSSPDRVTPLPIFSRSGDQSRKSYFGSRSFQLIRLSFFGHPGAALERTPYILIIS